MNITLRNTVLLLGLLLPGVVPAAEGMTRDPAAYTLSLFTFPRDRWEQQKDSPAGEARTFTVPRLKGMAINCTYTPLETGMMRPLPPRGNAIALGTIVCPGYGISDFERKNASYTAAEHIISSAMRPSHSAWLAVTGRPTHLLYENRPENPVASFRIVFRMEQKPAAPSPPDPLEQEVQEQSEERVEQEEEQNQKLQEPDRRGKIERRRENSGQKAVAKPAPRLRASSALCAGLMAEEYRACVLEMRNPRAPRMIPKNTVHDAAPAEERIPRRLDALRVRLQNPFSPLLNDRTGGTTNLAPTATQRQQLIKARQREVQVRTPEPDDVATGRTPVIRRRSLSLPARDRVGAAPLCRNRRGQNLIDCLHALGVEISARTVDAETLKFYEGIREK